MDIPEFALIEKEVRRLAAENPEHVYQCTDEEKATYEREYAEANGTDLNYASTCFYNIGNGGCIFGQAFRNLGSPVPAEYEGVGIHGLTDDIEAPVTKRQQSWMAAIQNSQDAEQPWGEALRNADETFPLYEEEE